MPVRLIPAEPALKVVAVSTYARMVAAIWFSAAEPAPLAPTPVSPEAPTATVVASTVAWMVSEEVAVMSTEPLVWMLVLRPYASTSTASSVYRSLHPIRLMARASPMATAGVVPLPTATDTAAASMVAVMEEVLLLVIWTLDGAMPEEFALTVLPLM